MDKSNFKPGDHVKVRNEHWTGIGSQTGKVYGVTPHRVTVQFDDGTLVQMDPRSLQATVRANGPSKEWTTDGPGDDQQGKVGDWYAVGSDDEQRYYLGPFKTEAAAVTGAKTFKKWHKTMCEEVGAWQLPETGKVHVAQVFYDDEYLAIRNGHAATWGHKAGTATRAGAKAAARHSADFGRGLWAGLSGKAKANGSGAKQRERGTRNMVIFREDNPPPDFPGDRHSVAMDQARALRKSPWLRDMSKNARTLSHAAQMEVASLHRPALPNGAGASGDGLKLSWKFNNNGKKVWQIVKLAEGGNAYWTLQTFASRAEARQALDDMRRFGIPQ